MTIVNGGSNANGGWWAGHLQNAEKNERVRMCEMRGLAADDIDGAFREMNAVAKGTDVKNYFYQANINPEPGEVLSPQQWQEAVDILEKRLGLTDQPRFVVEHEKHGRVHRHVIWSRIDIETGHAISDSLDYQKHQRAAREMEIKFDLSRGKSVLEPDRDAPRPERAPQPWETLRMNEGGLDPRSLRDEITGLWRTSDSGRAFAAALEERGYVLARGDRRDFVVLDHFADDHSLARRIQGARWADVRKHMADVNRDALPSVAEARATQRERYPTHEIALAAWRDRGRAASDPACEYAPRPKPGRAVREARDEFIARNAARSRQREERPAPILEAHTDTRVAGRATGKMADALGSMAGKVADIAADILSLGTAGTSSPSRDPRLAALDRIEGEERSSAALDRMGDSMKRGDGINREDLASLTREQLTHLRDTGDAGLHEMIRQHEEARERDRSYGLDR